MKIIVTGAAGLIGSHLVDYLLEDGHVVVGIDDLSYGNVRNLDTALTTRSFTFIQDKVQTGYLPSENVDVIFHLASMKKPFGGVIKTSKVLNDNFQMVKRVVEIAKSNNAFLIFSSTSDVYGNSNNFLENEDITFGAPTNTRYSYALSKLYGEQYILNEVQETLLQGSIVRIFGCASWRANKGWSGGHIPAFVHKALKGEDITIHGDGLQTRSISDAKDIAYGLKLMVDNLDSINGEIINLGTNEQTTVKEVAEYIVTKTDSKSSLIFQPREEVFGNYKEILVRFANTKKAEKLLGFKPRSSTFEVIDEIIEKFSDENSCYYSS